MKSTIDWARKPKGNCDKCGGIKPLAGIGTKTGERFVCKSCYTKIMKKRGE